MILFCVGGSSIRSEKESPQKVFKPQKWGFSQHISSHWVVRKDSWTRGLWIGTGQTNYCWIFWILPRGTLIPNMIYPLVNIQKTMENHNLLVFEFWEPPRPIPGNGYLRIGSLTWWLEEECPPEVRCSCRGNEVDPHCFSTWQGHKFHGMCAQWKSQPKNHWGLIQSPKKSRNWKRKEEMRGKDRRKNESQGTMEENEGHSESVWMAGDLGCHPYFGHGEGTEHFAVSGSAPPCPTQCGNSGFGRTLGEDKFTLTTRTFGPNKQSFDVVNLLETHIRSAVR